MGSASKQASRRGFLRGSSVIPQPYFSTFDSLELINEDFYDSISVFISVFVTQPLCNSYITSPRDVSGLSHSACYVPFGYHDYIPSGHDAFCVTVAKQNDVKCSCCQGVMSNA